MGNSPAQIPRPRIETIMQIVLVVIICIILWPAIVSGAKFILVTITAALIYIASTSVPEPTNIFSIQSGMGSSEVSSIMSSWYEAGKAEDYSASQKDDIMTSFRSLNNAVYVCDNDMQSVHWFYLQLEWNDSDGKHMIKIPSFTCNKDEAK